MKAIFKNFLHVLKRFKTASILNILGLSAALVVFVVCAMQTHYDLTFNHVFSDVDKLYQIAEYQDTNYGEYRNYATGYNNTEILRTNLPRLNKSNSVVAASVSVLIKYEQDGRSMETHEAVTSVEANFFDVFNIDIVAGSAENALSNLNKLIISEKTAIKIFGSRKPIGETLIVSLPQGYVTDGGIGISPKAVSMTIEAVCRDLPNNASFDNGFFTLFKPDRFEVLSGNKENRSAASVGSITAYYKQNSKHSYEELIADLADKKNIDLLRIGIPRDNAIQKLNREGKLEILETKLELLPISNIHLHHPKAAPTKGREMTSLLSLIGIAFITLLIAYSNFINFIIAMAPGRIKTLNIQKILGADVKILRLAIIGEAVLFTLLALILALVVVHGVSTAVIAEFFTANLELKNNLRLLIPLGIGLALISALIGIYPALYLSSFSPISSFGGVTQTSQGTNLRFVSNIVQYTSVMVMITVALFISMQYQYMSNYSMGLEKENIIVIEPKDKELSIEAFFEEANKSPYLVDATCTNVRIPSSYSIANQSSSNNGVYTNYSCFTAKRNYPSFFNIRVLEGESILQNKSFQDMEAVNKSLYDEYGLEITQSLLANGLDLILLDNFHFQDLKTPLSRLKMDITDDILEVLYFKIHGENMREGIQHLEDTWKSMSTEPFKYNFLDEVIDRQYKEEENLAILLTALSFITICIAIMGVYGLITFNSRYRAKEIAIRKVQGSTEKEIILLLNENTLWQFFVGFVVAVPIAYYLVSKWLEQFPYKTPTHWWVFALGGLLVLVITIITVSVQSYRAASANPVNALKNE